MILKNGKRLDGMGDSMPIGSIVEYNGTDVPDGWEILPGDANVYVGNQQPTEGQEVWVQKGKNLYNPKKSYITGSLYQDVAQIYDDIRVGETYTFSTPYTWTTIHVINSNGEYTRKLGGTKEDRVVTITIEENESKLEILFASGTSYLKTVNGIDFTGVQFEQNPVATTYEPFAGKRIYVKNEHGSYDRLYDESNLNQNVYMSQEQRIGTWVNNKPLYRRYVEGIFTGIGVDSAGYVDLVDLKYWDIETCAFLYGSIENVGGDHRMMPINSYETDTYNICFSYLGQTSYLQYKCVGWNATTNGWSFEYRVVLEYTKTTD
jgi:hypothetical protein